MRRIPEWIMLNKRILISIFILIFSLTACNLPSVEQTSPPGNVQTAAALTVEAELLHLMASATFPVTLSTNSLSPTFGPTATITPTYSVPILTVREQTNCRAGPGQEYEVQFTYLPNVKLEILGRYEPNNFWLVKSNESPSGECWLWGEYADAGGSYWTVPSVTPPPTATNPPPRAPVIIWDYFCSYSSNQINVELSWSDVANNETGYRVFRNGGMVAELPAISQGLHWAAFSPGGSLVVAGETGEIRIYDTVDWRSQTSMTTGASRPISAMAFVDNGRTLVVADTDFKEVEPATLTMFDLATGERTLGPVATDQILISDMVAVSIVAVQGRNRHGDVQCTDNADPDHGT